MTGELFGEYYYNHNCGRPYLRTPEWLAFFGEVAESIKLKLNPTTVLDAGCAKGFLVETLRDRGIDARGIDISEYAISEVYEPIRPYCNVASITDSFPAKYDLIVCIEVLEHMPSVEAARAVKNMCQHADTILFSSSPSDYSEATHFNVQQPEYWVREFGFHGFYQDLDFDASFLTSWAILFRRQQRVLADLAYNYERKRTQIRIENADLRKRNNALEEKIHNLEKAGVLIENSRKAEFTELLQSDNDALRLKIVELEFQLRVRAAEVEALVIENTEIRSSRSWKITKPLRDVKNIFSKNSRKG